MRAGEEELEEEEEEGGIGCCLEVSIYLEWAQLMSYLLLYLDIY